VQPRSQAIAPGSDRHVWSALAPGTEGVATTPPRTTAPPPPQTSMAMACLALYIPMAEGTALTGLLWYSNDGTVVFPEVLVASGVAGAPEPVTAAMPVALAVNGESSAWSELEFSEPVAALGDGFYVVFRLPEGSEHTASGAGGGAGLDYTVGANGYTGWLSLDGEEWVKLHDDFGMAIQPLVVATKTTRHHTPQSMPPSTSLTAPRSNASAS